MTSDSMRGEACVKCSIGGGTEAISITSALPARRRDGGAKASAVPRKTTVSNRKTIERVIAEMFQLISVNARLRKIAHRLHVEAALFLPRIRMENNDHTRSVHFGCYG